MIVKKYDPARKAYFDVEVKELEKEMKSMGFTKEEIAPKIENKQSEVLSKVAELIGAEEVELTEEGDIKVIK